MRATTVFFFFALLAVSQASQLRSLSHHKIPAHHKAAIQAVLSSEGDVATKTAALLALKAKAGTGDVWEKRLLDIIDELLANIQTRVTSAEQARDEAKSSFESNVAAQNSIITQKKTAISALEAQIASLKNDISSANGVISKLNEEWTQTASRFQQEIAGHNTNAAVVRNLREYIRNSQSFDAVDDQYDQSMKGRAQDNCLKVTLYEHAGFSGRQLTVTDRCEIDCINSNGFNDIVSGVIVEKGPAYTEGSTVYISEHNLDLANEGSQGRTYELGLGQFPFEWFRDRNYNDVLSRVAIQCVNHRSTASLAKDMEQKQAAAVSQSLSVNKAYNIPSGNFGNYREFFDLPAAAKSISFVFTAKTSNDIHVLLTNAKAERCTDCNEIVIGGWGNSQSVIRRGAQGTTLDVKSTSGFCSAGEARPFWVQVVDGTITVGRGDVVGANVFMTAKDANYKTTSFIGFAAWDQAASYVLVNVQ